jgi:predicted Zn-dependent protease
MSQTLEDEPPRVLDVIRQAVELDEQNDAAFATQILRDLVAEFPRVAIAHGYLGWILSRGGRHREAIECCRAAVQLAPTSERVSVLLFRVLWSAGESELAFDEMRRFVAIADSEEYARIIQELQQMGN